MTAAVRILWDYHGKQQVFDLATEDVRIGRTQPDAPVEIDLTPDLTVSRRHARIVVADGRWWIEDLGSRFGTRVAGVEIKGLGRRPIAPGDVIEVGESILRVDARSAAPAVSRPTVDNPPVRATDAAAGRIALLQALPLEFGAERRLDRLFETIVRRLVDVIPGARRSALLIRERGTGELLLKAHEPPGTPAVSLTLAQRAMEGRQAFVWTREPDPSASQVGLHMLSAVYAPVVWADEPLGVVCVDNSETGPRFHDDDRDLVATVAQYAGMAVVHRQLEDELARSATLVGRLLTNFSPRVRDRLLERAARGRLRLGGEKSEVTILCSDIRGFTRLSAGMDVDDVVDMLNDYFSALVDVLFACDGTVDKFVGDAILAVFGSPEPDAHQHEHAVRAALQMQAAVRVVNERRHARGLVRCEIGIGVHAGPVVHGFIGSAERMEFTVIGDAVNLASRYCDAAGAGEVLISPTVHEHVWRTVDAEPVSVPTKHEGQLAAFRITGARS